MPTGKKLQKKLAEDAGLGILMAALGVILAAPFYVHALGDGTAPTSGDGSLSESLRLMKDDLEVVRGRMDVLNGKLDTLTSRLETVYLEDSDSAAAAAGIMECLDACRKTASACYAPPSASDAAAPFAATPYMGGTGGVNAAACQARIESCTRACRPIPNTFSCDTTCAIQLGACVKGAGSDPLSAAACRRSNEDCLTSVCAKNVVGANRTRIQATALPPDTCRNQCLRSFSICRQANRLDADALTECAQTKEACDNLACGTQNGAAGAAAPYVQPKNIACENDCTRSFLACRTDAGEDLATLERCNTGYGACRNDCLIQSGGGFSETSATPTAP